MSLFYGLLKLLSIITVILVFTSLSASLSVAQGKELVELVVIPRLETTDMSVPPRWELGHFVTTFSPVFGFDVEPTAQ